MVTLPSGTSSAELHRRREMAEGFGSDPDRYDRARPRYPQALVDRIVAGSPGGDFLDVGIGTGIAARAFRAAGCTVVGVDVDDRMAAYARRQGFQVEVARFEEWGPEGRTFDAVVAGQTWHWVDPLVGAAKAASVLRPGGRLAVFWNAVELPAGLREAFADAFRQAVPGAPVAQATNGGPSGYTAFFANADAGIREAGAFSDPERWQVDWERSSSRDEWLDAMPTGGGFNRLETSKIDVLLAQVGEAIDAIGGTFTAKYASVAVTATRVT
ncbi:MAG: class I SAM-dependent methyltransferase [Acidimicrobiales bacterium]